MQNQRRHLDIPYLPELDSMTLDQAVKYLDEKGEHQTIDHLNWKEQYPYRPLTAFTIAHSDTQIYIDFFTRCNYLRAVNYKNNSDVYQDSCVEFFVAPHGEAPYYNFEFNCIGTIHAARRMDRHSGEKLTDEQLDSVRRLAKLRHTPLRGTAGNLLMESPRRYTAVAYRSQLRAGQPCRYARQLLQVRRRHLRTPLSELGAYHHPTARFSPTRNSSAI